METRKPMKVERLGLHYTGKLAVEKHHKVPKAHGGSDRETNLIPLTPKEHYVAHRLLAKMHPTCEDMARAVAFMSRLQNHPIPARTYSRLRSQVVLNMRGSKNHQAKSARIHDIKTGRIVASAVCITEWCNEMGIKNTGLRKTACGTLNSSGGYKAYYL